MATRDLTGRFVQLREYRFGAAPKRAAPDEANNLALLEVRRDMSNLLCFLSLPLIIALSSINTVSSVVSA